MRALRAYIHVGSKHVAHTVETVKATVEALYLDTNWEFADSQSPGSEQLIPHCDIFIAVLDEYISQRTLEEYDLATGLDKIRIALVPQACLRSPTESLKSFLSRLGESIPWSTYRNDESLQRKLTLHLVSELRRHMHALRLDINDLQLLEDSVTRLDAKLDLSTEGGDIAIQGGIIDKRAGSFFDRSVVIYAEGLDTVVPGTVYDHSLLPSSEAEFHDPVRIGSGGLGASTIIGGDIVRKRIKLEGFCHVKGSIYALEDVHLGSHLTVDGTVTAFGAVTLDGEQIEVGSLYAREVAVLASRCHVWNYLVCERFVTADKDTLITTDHLTVDGVLAGNGAITLEHGYSLTGIFVEGDLTLKDSCEAEFAVCTGRLLLSEGCRVACAVGKKVSIGPGSAVGALIARDAVEELGDCAHIDMLYAHRGIARVGQRVSIGNSHLLSREIPTETNGPIQIGENHCDRLARLGVLSNSQVVLPDSSGETIGTLFSTTIDTELYSLLAGHAKLRLTLPARAALV